MAKFVLNTTTHEGDETEQPFDNFPQAMTAFDKASFLTGHGKGPVGQTGIYESVTLDRVEDDGKITLIAKTFADLTPENVVSFLQEAIN